MKKILMSACLCFALGQMQTYAQVNEGKISYEVTQEVPLADFLSSLQSRTNVKIHFSKEDLKDIKIAPVNFSDESLADIGDYLSANLPVNVDFSDGEMYVSNLFGKGIYGIGNNVKLDNLVVTALGIKREEKALSYNVQQVKSEELTRVKDANFVNTLNGKVAGVQIQRSAAGVGGATKVVMRGAKSLVGDNNVLYVVDGMPLTNDSRAAGGRYGRPGGGEGISDFNPEDIESISVLTGPSAAALYGASAANGVILITTKKGKEGKLNLSLSSNLEFSTPYIMPEFQNTYGNTEGSYRSWGNKLDTPSRFDPKDFFSTGVNRTYSANLSVGTEKNQTYVSFASTNADGILPTNGYYRYNFGARNTAKFLDDKLHLDVSANYILQGDQNMISEGGYFNPLTSLYLFPRGESFEDVKAWERYNPTRGISEVYWPYIVKQTGFTTENPYWIVNREMFQSKKHRYMLYSSLKYDITDWLNVTGRVRVDNTYTNLENKFSASTDRLFAISAKGFYSNSKIENYQTYADFMANINKNFGDFNLVANIGTSYDDRQRPEIGIGGPLRYIPNLFSANNFDPNLSGTGGQKSRHTRNIAVFGSAELGYKSMLYLTLTGRNDWASQLVNSENPSIFYPSIGLSGVVSKMAKLPNFISFLKVRGSYTEVGSPITQLGVTPGTITYPLSPAAGLTPISTYPFPDFKAERTKSYEAGLNLKMFKNKFNLDLTLYHSNTYNQTFVSSLPASSGYSGFYVQAGDVQNEGIELAVGLDQNFGEFNWNTNLTYTRNINLIKELVRDYKNPIDGTLFNLNELYLKEQGNKYIREGDQISDVYVRGILSRDEDGNLIEGKSGLYEIDRSQLIKIGHTTPDFTIGWNNQFAYKNFNVGFVINGNFGGIVNSSTQAQLDAFGVSKVTAEARDNGGVNFKGKVYDAEKFYRTIGGEELMAYYTYDATNVRLQEASIGYSINGKKLLNNAVNRITLSLVGRNLWMIYNKAPFDPQLTASTGNYPGTEFFMTPSLRSFGFNVKVDF
ncbi:SusC/RagA family TonB-linked outer membrane protein [Ornithobacterium rhinotracheale]|uniref:SusC/RagA family TonB-linked outer membrane protein n=1 Tax=Ornithobacterium rhinotracheale TaxID=28251 RepID=UPI00129C2A56|nr:SusC/RagA family TonB-linked outer membrane protein [Ornithobacterium rhinotracheale]MRI64474.1 SusC/RagA family TonB-linked outer membrane protein [Ornithobacterium rhinotracheale]